MKRSFLISVLALGLPLAAKGDDITSTVPVNFTYDDQPETLVLAEEIVPNVGTTYYDANIGVEFFFYYDTEATPPGWFVVSNSDGSYLVDPDPVIWIDGGFHLEYPYMTTLADPPAATPEPSTIFLMLAGLAMLLSMWPRRSRGSGVR